MRVLCRVSIFLFCLLLLLPDQPAQAGWPQDSLVTAKAKIALFTARGVSGREVHVDTTNGVVTIHGKVSTEKERARAGEVVRGVKGVREVRNLLQVVPPFFREMVDVTDAVIRMRVERALEEDRLLEGSDVKVESVNNGVVLVTGDARTMGEYLIAIDDVLSVPGVRGIGGDVNSPDPLAEFLAGPGEADEAGDRELSAVAADLWITTTTKIRLLADPAVPGMDVDVDAWNGEVTLFGSVPSTRARDAAVQAAQRTKGVKRVENEIVVIPEQERDATRERDEILAKQVKRALQAPDGRPQPAIRVAANGGVVRLTGIVPSEERRLTAFTAACATPGVRAVEADLRVKRRVPWR